MNEELNTMNVENTELAEEATQVIPETAAVPATNEAADIAKGILKGGLMLGGIALVGNAISAGGTFVLNKAVDGTKKLYRKIKADVQAKREAKKAAKTVNIHVEEEN